MTTSITCPYCGKTSHHPQDVENGYCGNCHDFTTDVNKARQPPMWELVHLVTGVLRPLLTAEDLPKVLPDEVLTRPLREVLFEGRDVSLRQGPMYYTPDAEPITLDHAAAFAAIQKIRAETATEAVEHLFTPQAVPIVVSTDYLGIDVSTRGFLPTVWQTLVVIGDFVPNVIGPWQYATRAAAYAGHARLVDVVRQAVC